MTLRYFYSIKAPQKHLVVLDHAGHDPNQDVVDAEHQLQMGRIRSLAEKSGAVPESLPVK